MKQDPKCIFCKIINGEIPASKVYEDDKIFAFLDINPIHKGHTLVIPKAHYADVHEIPEELQKEVYAAVKRIAEGVKKATNCDGLSIFQNNGKAATQAVFHLHVHIVPRFDGDNLPMWPQGKYEEGEMVEFQQKIQSQF